MKRGTMLLITAGVCSLAFQSQRADATLITIAIEAEVDYVEDLGNYLEGRINPGDIITGTYTYESTTPDTNPLSQVADYSHYTPPHGISLSLSGFTFVTDPDNINFTIEIINDYTSGGLHDSYGVLSDINLALSNGTPVGHISWWLRDNSATAISTTNLPTTAPILGQWQDNILRIESDRAYIIDAHVTSAVPEPATILLLGLGGLVLVRRQN
ncbi:MAG: PEP-CTERM sorting domain-containing protein [Planctomycetota bacterium]|jgi:hypothetical protein